jgi:hypothetical protein
LGLRVSWVGSRETSWTSIISGMTAATLVMKHPSEIVTMILGVVSILVSKRLFENTEAGEFGHLRYLKVSREDQRFIDRDHGPRYLS